MLKMNAVPYAGFIPENILNLNEPPKIIVLLPLGIVIESCKSAESRIFPITRNRYLFINKMIRDFSSQTF